MIDNCRDAIHCVFFLLYYFKPNFILLKNAHFVKNKANNEIRFAIEDKYLRVALNAKLRECDYFAKS